MVEFFKKITDWVLAKEQEVANNCRINQADLDKQIAYVEEKRDKLKNEYEDNISEMEHILNRLHAIKAKSLKCDTK
jgi:hypothetical protein